MRGSGARVWRLISKTRGSSHNLKIFHVATFCYVHDKSEDLFVDFSWLNFVINVCYHALDPALNVWLSTVEFCVFCTIAHKSVFDSRKLSFVYFAITHREVMLCWEKTLLNFIFMRVYSLTQSICHYIMIECYHLCLPDLCRGDDSPLVLPWF